MSIEDSGGFRSSEDRATKKVRFKGTDGEEGVDMIVDMSPEPMLSWKDRLLGRGALGSKNSSVDSDRGFEEYFELLDRDVMRSTVNGVLSIMFSNRVQRILVKEMATMVVVKLLGEEHWLYHPTKQDL
ncbi:hypothetical protein V6Z11_D03G077900 [Gossypium hirsutum]